NPLLALISVVPAPLVIYFSRKFTRRMSTGYDSIQKIFADLTEGVREAFAGIRVVKAYQREAWGHRRIEDEGNNYLNANIKLARTIALFFPMMALFTNLSLAIVIWLGGSLTVFGEISTGEFVAFIGYLNLLTWPMMAIGWVTNLYQRGSASMRRINRILDEKPEITDPSLFRKLPAIRGGIIFKDFNFRYSNKSEYALKGISMTIEPGQTVAIVGRVGSGKTTLLQVIPRLLDGPVGSLFIDGEDILDYPLRDLRKSIGFVTQDSIIFSDTIRNNVVFGRDSISEDELEKALKTAEIHEDILKLEKGVETVLGERGITLSGGQRQRLTIARSLLSDPPILILDDSLSMVDTRTEESILNNILELRKNKTNLIVSHRYSTISRADLIAVFENGVLVEIGDYKSLMKKRNEFARLYRKQLLAQELGIGMK
ncbi:ABC transporter ATP-binding protein, partial [Thermodesulfobacteriota bacterium]